MSTSHTDTDHDRGMLKVMGMVLLSLCLLSLFIVSMARLLGLGRTDDSTDPLMRKALISRIQPVGAVRTSAEGLEVASAEGAAGGAVRTADELVNGVCAGCHAAAVAGAPLLGDDASWAPRREAGIDALVASVTNGKGSMPARGGSDYSDDEIRLAVEHIAMFEPSGDSADGGAGASDGDAAAAESTPADGAADGEANSDAGAAPAEEAASTGGESIDLAALVASGTVPEGMPENVKGAVDGVCAGCHIAGVAEAPKFGDKAAWGARAELGLAALTQSVKNGKGVMPALGGSQLTDAEIPIAIQYLIGKQ